MAVRSVETFSKTNENGNSVLFAQRYDETHAPVGEAIQITPDEVDAAYARSTLVLSNGGFVVAYDFVDPTGSTTSYPFAFLETREFTPSGQLLATNLIGQDDYNKTAGIESIALANGAYASIVFRSEGYANGGESTRSLQFVDPAGHAQETQLYAEYFSDVPYPQLRFTEPSLLKLGNGNFSVSWKGSYTESSPEYPPPTPYPTGNEEFSQVYRGDGSLLSSTFIDFNHATDLYSTSVTAKLPQGLYNLTLIGNDRISGTGNELNNTLVGNDNRNHLVGLGGDDRLDGGLGTDYLQGGAGRDTFVFSMAIKKVFNSDLVADFVLGQDVIELSAKIFTGLAQGHLAAGTFTDLSAGPANANAHVIYDAAGNLFFDADGSGSGAAQQFATLTGHPALTESDIIVV